MAGKNCQTYDCVYIGKSSSKTAFGIHSTSGVFVQPLIEHFPAEEEAIKKYFKMVTDACKGEAMFRYIKLLPQSLVNLLNYTRLINWAIFFQMSKNTLQAVLDEITDNGELKTVLSYNFGYYGNFPNDTSFVIHAMLVNHFLNGAYYPIGGGSEIAFHIIPVIERSGG